MLSIMADSQGNQKQTPDGNSSGISMRYITIWRLVFILALIARFAAVVDVEAGAFENDARRADHTVDMTFAFGTNGQRFIVKRLIALEANAAIFTLIFIE